MKKGEEGEKKKQLTNKFVAIVQLPGKPTQPEIWQNAPSHRPKIVRERKNITCIFLPPYSPELNPAERFFEEIRKSTANQIFETLEKQEEVIAEAVRVLSGDMDKMKQLLGYEWIKEQIRRG